MGTSKAAEPPKPPSAYKSTMGAIQAQADALPKILAAQQRYGGKFTEEELAILQQYGPQFANLQQEISGITAPHAVAGQRLLAEEFARPADELLTAGEAQQFRADSRAATSARGLGESGFGALEEVQVLTALRQQIKLQRLNLALGSMGSLPQATSFTQPSQISPGLLMQNVAPSQIFDMQSNAFTAQSNAAANRYGTDVGFWNNMVTALGSGNKSKGTTVS